MRRSETTFRSQFLSSTMWVPGIEFQLPGLMASAFTHCAVLLARVLSEIAQGKPGFLTSRGGSV